MGAPYPPLLSFHMGDLDLPCNNMMLWAHTTHNPNGTSIGSAMFAQMTAECSFTGFPSKLLLPMLASGPHVIHGSLAPTEYGTQMAT